jgi:protein-tyrosine phosphatase
VPADERAFLSLVHRLRSDLSNGSAVAIHCRAGIGRSTVLAACILVGDGLSVERAFQLIAEARGCPVPDTKEQREWVDAFARSEPDRGIDFRPR